MSTILITGCSSGFGSSAVQFAEAGDAVYAGVPAQALPVSCVQSPTSTSNSTSWTSTSSIRPVSRRASKR